MRDATLDKLWRAMKASKGIPAAEHAVASVLGSLDNSERGKQQAVGHIIEDFALTQKVLQLANSSMYAPFSVGTDSVSAAVNVLGSEAVLHLVLGADIASDEDLVNDHNLAQTLTAAELARTACADRAEAASVATLMYEIGRLMTGKHLQTEAAAIAQRITSGMPAEDAAIAVLGISYQDLGVELAARWNLPQTLRANIDGTGDTTLVGIAKFSSAASTLMHDGKAEEAGQLLQKLDVPGIDKSRLGAWINEKTAQIRITRPAKDAANCESELQALLLDLSRTQHSSLEELSNGLLPGLGQALGAAHCLVFMVTRTGEMRVRSAYGKGIDEIRSRLRISAEFMPTAFHAAIENRVDVSIGDVSKLKDAALPDGYRTLLPRVSRFIILPIANTQVTGLLYCDWDTERPLRPVEMNIIKKLRDLLLPLFPP